MKWRQVFASVLALWVVVGALTVGSAAPVDSATAQEVPSIPAVYYGEVSVTDGSVTSTFEIDAVADGEVQDTIEVTPNGTFGGPTISDDGLEVQEPDSGEVEFHVGGTPVTIVSVGGESIDDTTAPWDSGTQEVVLEVDAETIAPSLNVTITNASTSIQAGDTATVEADIANTGVVDATQEIELVNSSGTVLDSTAVTLQPGNTTGVTLAWATSEGLVGGNETLTIRSEQDAENVTITVEASDTPPIAPPPSSGGGGGGGGGVEPITEQPIDDTNETATNGTDTPSRLGIAESQSIVTSERFGLSQVRFTTESNIVAITWEGTEFNGSVTAATFARTPPNVSAVPGAMATVSQVTVPEDITNRSAVVEQRVTRDRLNEIDADVADLQVYRYADGAWTPVPTTVNNESGEEIIVESEVPGFSYLAVSAVSEPTAAIDAPATVTAGESITLAGSASTDEYGTLTAYEWTVAGESLSGETATATIETAGEVTVELEVTNDAGETNTTTTTITVEEATATTTTAGGTTETATGTEGTDSSTPGFTIALTVIALLVSSALARRLD